MKKIGKITACILTAMLCCSAASACGTEGNEGTEKIDNTRTQIYVYNFYGGFGSDWLSEAKKRFEELHKDDEGWEEGKKGVQVMLNNKKESLMSISSQILGNRDEVYFTEYAYYYTLKAEGVLGDITDVVTGSLSDYGENGTILNKYSDEQKNYYGIEESDGTHYYALPHYSGYSGLIYNKDLFDSEGYYFAKTPSDSTRYGVFVDPYNTEKSAGPDGEYGTEDDGLPATYDEFFLLCDYIKDGGTTPVIWNGFDYKNYLNNLVQALAADYEGVDQSMMNYTFRGTPQNLVKSVDNGVAVTGAGEELTDANGWQLKKQAGNYYALSFLEKLMNNDAYHNTLAFNSSFSHMNAQEDFLYAGNDGQTRPIAMLCDGIWWEAEAKDTFKALTDSKGDKFSKYNRHFGFMPLPHATAQKAEQTAGKPNDEKFTLYDGIYSLCFMKANVAEWKQPLVKDFIRFMYTDASLKEFTKITNTVKALNYTLSEADKAELTPFGRSLVELKDKSRIVYPFSNNSLYVNNQSFFATSQQYRSQIGSNTYEWCSEAIHEKKISAKDYFNGMETYYKDKWTTLN